MRRIHVVAAVIRNAANEILIAERPKDKHQGGLWEFPGGKVEEGEAVEAALVRELEEELGIIATQFRPLIQIAHDYPDKQVLLDVWEVSAFHGEAHGRENQPVRWVAAEALPDYAFPAANVPIVSAARLPATYLITPDPSEEPDLLAWSEQRLQRGVRLLCLRAKSLALEDYVVLAGQMLALCRHHGARLLLSGDPALLGLVAADGIHLPASLFPALSERPLPPEYWLAASVHDRAELEQAQRLGVDFVTLSPVQATVSHPGVPGMGWAVFAELVFKAVVPVYALGGLAPDDLPRAWAAGAQGVAGIRHVVEL